jgi:hypothetical protein
MYDETTKLINRYGDEPLKTTSVRDWMSIKTIEETYNILEKIETELRPVLTTINAEEPIPEADTDLQRGLNELRKKANIILRSISL